MLFLLQSITLFPGGSFRFSSHLLPRVVHPFLSSMFTFPFFSHCNVVNGSYFRLGSTGSSLRFRPMTENPFPNRSCSVQFSMVSTVGLVHPLRGSSSVLLRVPHLDLGSSMTSYFGPESQSVRLSSGLHLGLGSKSFCWVRFVFHSLGSDVTGRRYYWPKLGPSPTRTIHSPKAPWSVLRGLYRFVFTTTLPQLGWSPSWNFTPVLFYVYSEGLKGSGEWGLVPGRIQPL